MIIYNLESKNFNKMIQNNEFVLIGVYEKKCIISELFKGTLYKINNLIDKKIVVSMIEQEEFFKNNEKEEKQIFPTLIVFKNGSVIKKICGFSNYKQVLNELNCLN